MKYVFTMIDSFSKFAWCYPSENKTSGNFLNALKNLYDREGTWKIFHSDNGGEFTANSVKAFITNVMKAEIVHGAPYRPQTQGQIERFNRTLKSRLRKALGAENRNWIAIIDSIVRQYNSIQHKATQLSPFVLFKGHDPRNTNWENPEAFFDIQQVRIQFSKYVANFRIEYDSRRNIENLNVGDRVLVAREFNPNLKRRSHAL